LLTDLAADIIDPAQVEPFAAMASYI